MEITVKFVIPSDGNLQLIQQLAQTSLTKTLARYLSKEEINRHLEDHYNAQSLVRLLNDFNNKCLFAYVKDKLAGYAIFSSFCEPPEFIGDMKGMQVTHLQAPDHYSSLGVKDALLERCLQLADPGIAIWSLQIKTSNTVNVFLNHGFLTKKETETVDGIAAEGVYLIKEP